MNIPEEVLNLAASEVFDELPSCAMCLTGKSTCVYCTDDATRYARAALSAAAPTLMAMALREAADDAFKDKSVQGLARVTIGNWLRARADKEAL